MDFDSAFQQLMSSWLRHEQAKETGAPIPELFQARVALDRARYEAARSRTIV